MEERRGMQESVVKKHRQVLVRHADENLAKLRKKLPGKRNSSACMGDAATRKTRQLTEGSERVSDDPVPGSMNLVRETRDHLEHRILPFWKGLRDDIHGGYVGYVGYDLKRDPMAERGCILNSRILYFFSQASMSLSDPSLLSYAAHAYETLLEMTDSENGGVFWSMHPDGTVLDPTKHTYNQAFAIYALSNYALASGKTAPLEKARELFHLIEHKCRDAGGYLEAFHADFTPESNEKLSENGVMAERTMNTLLHVLEAYTELYRVGRDPEVREKLLEILDTWEQHVYNPEKKRQEVFFDHEWHTLIDLHSFGHDIETSWLCDRTLEVLEDEELTKRIWPKLLSLAEQTLEVAYTTHGFANESENGKVNTMRIWWVQAEALLGFLNAWQKTGEEKYLDAVRHQWTFIKEHMADPREGSEWFWWTSEHGIPVEKPIVEPWKCPYHNGRMVFEIMRRLKDEEL